MTATPQQRGKRLEQLALWLLPHLPGLQVNMVNVTSQDYSQEVDLVCWNEVHYDNALPVLGSVVMVEAKNRVDPVGSSDVVAFDHKLKQGACRSGILIASNGITGSIDERSSAGAIIRQALVEDRRIIVLTMSEIAGLNSRPALRELIIAKLLQLSAGRGLP